MRPGDMLEHCIARLTYPWHDDGAPHRTQPAPPRPRAPAHLNPNRGSHQKVHLVHARLPRLALAAQLLLPVVCASGDARRRLEGLLPRLFQLRRVDACGARAHRSSRA